MSTRKPLADQIEAAQEEIRQRENRLKELLQKQKEQDRKARTHRLCERGGLLETLLPDTISLTSEQFKTFLEKTVANDFGRRTLANIAARGGASAAPIPSGGAPTGGPAGTAKTVEAQRPAG